MSSEDHKDLLKQNPKSVTEQASVQKTSIEQNQFPQIFDEKKIEFQGLVETVRLDGKLSSKSPKYALKRNSQCVSIKHLFKKLQ